MFSIKQVSNKSVLYAFFLSFVCLSVAEPPTEVACVSVTKILDMDTYFYEVNANHGSWPADGFCRVISKVEITDSEPYILTVEIMNVFGSHGLTDFGHPGVMYNVVDENNFDAISGWFFAKNLEKKKNPNLFSLR